MAQFRMALHARMDKVWEHTHQHTDPREHATNRKLVTYEHWFALKGEKEGKPPVPYYLKCELPAGVARNMARFRVSSHNLMVETGRYSGVPWQDRICDLCGTMDENGMLTGAVQDEKHVTLECCKTADLRIRYFGASELPEQSMQKLMNTEHARVALFVSDCMNMIDARRFPDDDYMGEMNIDDEDGEGLTF